MSRKKGLSVEEKRTKMMEFFYETKDFFQLKELERLCQKEKGITSMSVKEILQSLVDDGMVDTEKIGTSVYFWAFPSKASQSRKRKLSDVSSKLTEVEQKKRITEESMKKMKVGREETAERTKLMEELERMRKEKEALVADVERYKECDPEVMEMMKKEIVIARDAANRWTDNIFAIKSWIKSKFNCDDETLNKQFGLPDELDYVD